jgi:hypothetical protein
VTRTPSTTAANRPDTRKYAFEADRLRLMAPAAPTTATSALEKKWIAERTEAPALYAFRQKVAGKSAYTRGVFIAVEGFTAGAITALGTGQSRGGVILECVVDPHP